MAKCFLTGIDLELENAWILDRGGARRALRNLQERLAAVERIVTQLSPRDDVQVFNQRTETAKSHPQHRLVSKTVAGALSASYPEAPLFVAWRDFIGGQALPFRRVRHVRVFRPSVRFSSRAGAPAPAARAAPTLPSPAPRAP